MKSITVLIFLTLFCLSTVPAINADVIDPGQKEIPLYYQITNINSYPDYVFLLYGNPSPTFMALNNSEFKFYKLSTASIYAIPKTEYNQTVLENMSSTQLDNYFTNNTSIIPSNIELKGGYGSVNQTSTLEKVVIELEITSINQTNLEIKKTRAKYFYTDGSNRTLDFQEQNTIPQPDASPQGFNLIWYLLLPLVALIAIILVLFWRRRTG